MEEEQFRDALSAPTSNMPDLTVDDIVRIATASAQAAARELATRNPSATPEAAAAASHTVKKVELPTFDKANIHTWIRRVEAAFGRAGVTTAKDKFFFIESKIDVNLNPKINEFLCGDSTEAKWDEFLEYLQNEYGRSKEQQAALFLRGIPREGLRPTQHLAKIRDLTKDVTLDDLVKEMILRDVPPSICQSLAERTNLTPDDAAKAADHYFDKDGNPKHKAAASTINNISNPPEMADVGDDSETINAVNRNKFRGLPSHSNGHQSRPAARTFTPAFSNAPRYTAPQGNRNHNRQQNRSSTLQRICKYHLDFGERAVKCEQGCQFKKHGVSQSGNGAAGRRK